MFQMNSTVIRCLSIAPKRFHTCQRYSHLHAYLLLFKSAEGQFHHLGRAWGQALYGFVQYTYNLVFDHRIEWVGNRAVLYPCKV